MAVSLIVFAFGAVLSLTTSWVLVSRLERLGQRVGFTEALLGLVAALAADAPEITAAVTALSHRERAVGAGVVLGSNVFNLAALLGLAAVAGGGLRLHRRVVVFDGAVGLWVAAVGLVAVLGGFAPGPALGLCLVVLVPYVAVHAVGSKGFGRLAPARRLARWVSGAVAEEESELSQAIAPRRGTAVDAAVAAACLVVVVGASVAMERAASSLGQRWAVPGIVVGGLVLAAVTSLPNAVAGFYLGSRGQGAAVLSVTLNSNTLNVVVGLLTPAVVTGIGRPSTSGALVAAWYAGLTLVVLGLAGRRGGLARTDGWLIVAGYAAFVVALLAVVG